jgi:hypothetical protein
MEEDKYYSTTALTLHKQIVEMWPLSEQIPMFISTHINITMQPTVNQTHGEFNYYICWVTSKEA